MRKSVRKIMITVAAGVAGAVHVVLPGKATAAEATDPYYVGASVGQSSFQTSFFNDAGGTVSFRGQPLGWKLFLGARPFSFLGAEIEYLDFGEAHFGESGEITSSAAEARGGAAFAVGYLPVPVPNLDVFGKLGVARYRAAYQYSGDFPNTCIYSPTLDECETVGRTAVSGASDATGLAYGIGAQYRFGAFAVRAELEKINTTESATAPSLLSVGLTYRF
jgi:hypothetical protein